MTREYFFSAVCLNGEITKKRNVTPALQSFDLFQIRNVPTPSPTKKPPITTQQHIMLWPDPLILWLAGGSWDLPFLVGKLMQ
jgi:hypothetical protein